MHQVHTGRSPPYLSNLVTATANLTSRQALPFIEQPLLWSSTNETEARRKSLSVRWTVHVELSSCRSPKTIWHYDVQKIVENFSLRIRF